MPLILVRLFAGNHFPPEKSIYFATSWCDREGEVGPFTPDSNGFLKIYEEIAFPISESDERLWNTTTLILSYGLSQHKVSESVSQCKADISIDLKSDIFQVSLFLMSTIMGHLSLITAIQTFCKFCSRGKSGKSPFIEVHVGLESLFIERETKALADTTCQSSKKQRLDETSLEHQEQKLIIDSYVPDVSGYFGKLIASGVVQEQLDTCSQNELRAYLVDEWLERSMNYLKDNYEKPECVLSKNQITDHKGNPDNMLIKASADLGTSPEEVTLHPALQALSDSGWDDGSEMDDSGFLKWEFQTKNYHTVIMDVSVSDTSWDMIIRSKIDIQISSKLDK